MLPVNIGGHSAYQDTFVSEFLKFYPDPFSLPKSTWDYIVPFWYLDLSMTDSIMQECYSIFGPEPRLPSCIFAFLSACFKIESDFHHGLVPHAQGNSSLCNPQRIFFSEILPVSGLFMISFPASGRMTNTTFHQKTVSLR
ncbi:MAG: hypothetical protein ACLU8S_13860 [Coprococcus phoceensis]